jgi:hypothetical protein
MTNVQTARWFVVQSEESPQRALRPTKVGGPARPTPGSVPDRRLVPVLQQLPADAADDEKEWKPGVLLRCRIDDGRDRNAMRAIA